MAAEKANNADANAGPRGRKYELTAKGTKLDPETLTGLRAELFKLLQKSPMSVDEVLDSGKVSSNAKNPKKVVASYLTVWKREGMVRFAKEK